MFSACCFRPREKEKDDAHEGDVVVKDRQQEATAAEQRPQAESPSEEQAYSSPYSPAPAAKRRASTSDSQAIAIATIQRRAAYDDSDEVRSMRSE